MIGEEARGIERYQVTRHDTWACQTVGLLREWWPLRSHGERKAREELGVSVIFPPSPPGLASVRKKMDEG